MQMEEGCMLIHRRAITLALAVTFIATLALSCGDDDDFTGPDNDEPIDLVKVERVSALSTDTGVKVDVTFSNATPLSALEVPLRVTGSGFTIDSVSFSDSRIAWVDDTISTILPAESSIILAAIEYDSVIVEGHGLLGSIYFTLNQASQGETLTIDTVTVDMIPIFHSLVYQDTSAAVLEIVPAFEPGEISVLF